MVSKSKTYLTPIQRYREKIKIKRKQTIRFDKQWRTKEAIKKANWRRRNEKSDTSLVMSNVDRRANEGKRRRRSNTYALRKEIRQLREVVNQLKQNTKISQSLSLMTTPIQPKPAAISSSSSSSDIVVSNQRWAAPTPERPLHGASSAPWSGAERAIHGNGGAGAESERYFFYSERSRSELFFCSSSHKLLFLSFLPYKKLGGRSG